MNSETDEQKIRVVVKGYFDGTYNGDKEMLLKVFHPDAHIVGIFNGALTDWTRSEFIKRVTSKPTQSERNEEYTKKIMTIDSEKDVAMVKAVIQTGGHYFTDYITLLKINGRWIIRNKSYTTSRVK